jgi:formiminotetrahydrofolate cyclodeaminase
MACGLIGMVCKLSTKKDYGVSPEKQLEYADELEKIKKKLLDGTVKDVDAYATIKNAYKLPKETEEEENIRKKAISDAGVVGATAPMENGYLCKRVLEIAEALQGKTNPSCGSDFDIGVGLAREGVKGCVMNIEANISMIKEEEKLKRFESAIEELKVN